MAGTLGKAVFAAAAVDGVFAASGAELCPLVVWVAGAVIAFAFADCCPLVCPLFVGPLAIFEGGCVDVCLLISVAAGWLLTSAAARFAAKADTSV